MREKNEPASKKLDFPETGKFVMTLECQGFQGASVGRWRLAGNQPYDG